MKKLHATTVIINCGSEQSLREYKSKSKFLKEKIRVNSILNCNRISGQDRPYRFNIQKCTITVK